MSPFAATWGKTPKLGIAPSSSSERNPAFAASPSRFTSNNTAWVSPASWPVGLSPLPIRGYRPNGSGRSSHDRSNLSPLQAPDKILLDRSPPQPFDFGKRLIEGGFSPRIVNPAVIPSRIWSSPTNFVAATGAYSP